MRRGAVGVSATWHLFGCSLVGMSAVGVALIGVSARAGQGSGAGQSVSWVAVAYSGLGVLGVLGRGGWCIGVSVYCRTPAPIAPRASLDAIPRRSLPMPRLDRCIGVLPQSCADRSQGRPGSVYRCIAAVLRRSLPGPPWIGVSVYRCITAVRRRSLPGPPWIGVSVYRCITAIPRRSLPGPPWIGVSVYRCITAVRRRSLPGPPWIGVSVYRCITAIRPRSLPGPPWIGVSVYRGNRAPIAHGAPLGRCIGVSVHGKGGSVYRCISIFLPPPAVALPFSKKPAFQMRQKDEPR